MNGSDELYADCIHLRCGHCGAEPDVRCRNTITNKVMRAPHYHRIQAAEKAAS